MHRLLILLLLVLSFAGCTQNDSSPKNKKPELPMKVHGSSASAEQKSSAADSGMVAVVKKQYLQNYKAATVGEAFEAYKHFSKKEWSESSNSNGTFYIDFTGWFDSKTVDVLSIKEAVSKRGIQVKFVIYDSGSFGVAMVSKLEAKTDGKVYAYPLDDIKAFVDKIYANKEISF